MIKQGNTCEDGIRCDDNKLTTIASNNNCYDSIVSVYNHDSNLALKKSVDKYGVNECIQKLNAKLKCDKDDEGDWYLNCPAEFKDATNPLHKQIITGCTDEETTFENIVEFCSNNRKKKPTRSIDICKPEYKNSVKLEMKKYENTNGVKMMFGKLLAKDSGIKDIDCGDCNTTTLPVNGESDNKFRRYFSNGIQNKVGRDDTKYVNCHEYSKMLRECDANSKALPLDHDFNLVKIYDKFVKGEKLSDSTDMSGDQKDLLITAAMCKIAKDNMKKQPFYLKQLDFNNWWKENVFGESGFQQLIYIISLMLCMLLKYNILTKYNFPGFEYAGLLLLISTFIITIGTFIIYMSEYQITNDISMIVFVVFVVSILMSLIIRSISLHKYGIWLSIAMGCIFALVIFKFALNISTDIFAIDILILLITIMITGYISFKIYFNKFIGILLVLVITLFLLYLLLLIDGETNTYIMKIYFYIIIFMILIIINVITSQLDVYDRVMGILLKPFGKNDNKMLVTTCLIIYFILGLSDGFLTVMSPQMSLFMMIILRLILKRWYEPLNGLFVAISGYSMDINDGKKDSTYNSDILTLDTLSSLFSN
jgi:hypothetical protein